MLTSDILFLYNTLNVHCASFSFLITLRKINRCLQLRELFNSILNVNSLSLHLHLPGHLDIVRWIIHRFLLPDFSISSKLKLFVFWVVWFLMISILNYDDTFDARSSQTTIKLKWISFSLYFKILFWISSFAKSIQLLFSSHLPIKIGPGWSPSSS